MEANGIALATHVALERQDKQDKTTVGFQSFEPTEPFQLVETCTGHAPDACVTPDHAMQLVRWSGMTCGTQCGLGCRGTVPYGPGSFRFVLTTCDHAHVYPSPPFDLQGSGSAASDDRVWAATATSKATIARLEQQPKWDATSAPSVTTIAGMNVRGAKQTLDDDARRALTDALASQSGFDDSIQKRCVMSKLVGFELTRSLPTTGTSPREQTNEIAIDFNCQKIFVVRGDHAPRFVHASHFDPSRPAFLALAKKLVPELK